MTETLGATDLWGEISTLSGETLETLGQRKIFDIVLVDSKGVVVRPHANGVERRIQRKDIEGAFSAMRGVGHIDLLGIRKHSEMNPVYVAAMLARLSYVSIERKPKIRLSLRYRD